MTSPITTSGLTSRMRKNYPLAFSVLSIVASLCCLYNNAFAQPQTAAVIDVIDGDTLIVEYNGQQETVDIYGVDCPEMSQDYGLSAKNFTARKVSNQHVQLTQLGLENGSTPLVLVEIGQMNLNEQLLVAGYGWVAPQQCKQSTLCTKWLLLQQNAKKARAGLWADKTFIPPWNWRRRHE